MYPITPYNLGIWCGCATFLLGKRVCGSICSILEHNTFSAVQQSCAFMAV